MSYKSLLLTGELEDLCGQKSETLELKFMREKKVHLLSSSCQKAFHSTFSEEAAARPWDNHTSEISHSLADT